MTTASNVFGSPDGEEWRAAKEFDKYTGLYYYGEVASQAP